MISHSKRKIILTMDTDWCPNYVLSYALSLFKELPITIFATHKYSSDIFSNNHEIGIHPNLEYLKNLTNNSLNSVFEPLLNIYPEARSCRTHKLFWASSLDPYLVSKKIYIDSSLQLFNNAPLVGCSPSGLLRYPILWSDGLFINYKINIKEENINFSHNVISVHPIHLWLNTSMKEDYDKFKMEVPRLDKASSSVMDKFFDFGSENQIGIRNIITKLVEKTNSTKFIFFPKSHV
tara:strand:- start:1648 stop:2352 length:705 start_codon:yes stop_codon:yes gene_type:complete